MSPWIGIGTGIGNSSITALSATVAVLGTIAETYYVDAAASIEVTVTSGVDWTLTINGETAATGTGTGAPQSAAFTPTDAMRGVGVTVALAAASVSDSGTTTVADPTSLIDSIGTWTNVGWTSYTADGDGIVTAVANDANAQHRTLGALSATGTYRFTIDVKRGTGALNFVRILGAGANIGAAFNVATGTKSADIGSPVAATIVAAGDYWRCSITATGTFTDFRLNTSLDGSSGTAIDSGTYYFKRAIVELVS